MTEAEGAVATLLRCLGEDPEREGLRETPARVVRALLEMTSGRDQDLAAILATRFEEPCDEMVVVRDVPFWSLCEHHLLPFGGSISVGYIPGSFVLGLSKVPRLVQVFARRLQIQERLTRQVAEALFAGLDCVGVGVLARATHTCMASRGARSTGCMVTSSLLGAMRQPEVRAEFLRLASERDS